MRNGGVVVVWLQDHGSGCLWIMVQGVFGGGMAMKNIHIHEGDEVGVKVVDRGGWT